MKTKIIIAFIALLPMLAVAQTSGSFNAKKCKFDIDGTDSFAGNAKKTTTWFFVNGKDQPEMDIQFAQDGDNYFINLAFTPQFYKKNYKGYNQPDTTNPNSLQVKFDNGEVVTYSIQATQSNVFYNYNTYGDGITRYYPVYKISKEQLEQLSKQNIAKVRVNYNNGYYVDTNADIYSQHQVRINAACMQPGV